MDDTSIPEMKLKDSVKKIWVEEYRERITILHLQKAAEENRNPHWVDRPQSKEKCVRISILI